jgi:hypothetical protein
MLTPSLQAPRQPTEESSLIPSRKINIINIFDKKVCDTHVKDCRAITLNDMLVVHRALIIVNYTP